MKLGSVPTSTQDRHKLKFQPGVPKLPCLAMLVSKRGQGKSTLAARLVKSYVQQQALDPHLVYIVSPTIESQNHIVEYLGMPAENAISVSSDKDVKEALATILEQVAAARELFDSHETYCQAYTKLSHRKQLTQRELALLESRDCSPPAHGVTFPRCAVILDDLSHFGKTLTSNWFTSLCLRHRHVASGTGVSLFILVQSLKGGLCRPVRQNASLIVLWQTHDKTNLDDLYKECSHLLDRENFYSVFKDATQNVHDFLTIDLTQSNPNAVFSKNFDVYYKLK